MQGVKGEGRAAAGCSRVQVARRGELAAVDTSKTSSSSNSSSCGSSSGGFQAKAAAVVAEAATELFIRVVGVDEGVASLAEPALGHCACERRLCMGCVAAVCEGAAGL
jgi:hypothetical protein